MRSNFMDFLNILYTILMICGAAGGIVAFIASRKTKIFEIQHQTIGAMQEQLDVIERKVEGLETENTRLTLVIDTIQSALKQKGIIISINGEMVTITDTSGTSSSLRKPAPAKVKRTAT